jgi:hypothetical protein
MNETIPLFVVASEWEICPVDLLFGLQEAQREEAEALAEIIAARKAARKATGLTSWRLHRWEDAGRDYSTWVCPNGFGLDVIARELAGMYPALGLGEGYGDEKDYAALLWVVLRVADPVMRNAEEMLREVAERIASMSEAAPF